MPTLRILLQSMLLLVLCGCSQPANDSVPIPTGPGAGIIKAEGNTEKISWHPDGTFVWDAPVGDRVLCAFPLPERCRFEDFGLCTFDLNIEGGPVNVMIFLERPGEKRMIYRPIDVHAPPDGWQTMHLDLNQPEIVREGHFNPEEPCVAFHLWSMDTGYPDQESSRRIEIKNLRLRKRYLAVDWNGYDYKATNDNDGDLVYTYIIAVSNMDDTAHLVVPSVDCIEGKYGSAHIRPENIQLAPGELSTFTVELRLPEHHLKNLPMLYCEWFRPEFSVEGVPGSGEGILRSSDRISLPLIIMPDTDGSNILFDRGGMELVCGRFKNTDWGRKEGQGIISQAENILKQDLSIPDGPGWARAYYYCHEHRCVLQYEGVDKHRCPVGGEYRDVDFDGVDLDRDYRAGEHNRVTGWTKTLAMAYFFTGDKRFSEAALNILNQYREHYFKFDWLDLDVSKITIDKGRFHFAKYMESYGFRNMTEALVMLRLKGGVDEEEAQKIQNELLLPGLTEIADYRMGTLCRQGTISVSALTGGLAFNNAPLTAFAVHSPHGYFSLRQWGASADGIAHGHGYSQTGYTHHQVEMAQLLHRIGIDTFDHKLKRLIDGSFWWSVPMNPARIARTFSIAAKHYPDPVYRTYAQRSLMDGDPAELGTEKTVISFKHSVNFPNSGLTILRRPLDDGLLEAEFKWSMPDNRGSFSVLSLGLQSYGFRCQSYPGHFHWGSTDLHHNWQIQTASHSTIVVDRHNQSDMKDYFKDFYMPHPSKQLFFEDGKDAAVTVAYNDRIYPGVKIWRVVAVLDGAALVIDCLRSDSPHTYDRWFHGVPDKSNGLDGFSLDLKPRSEPLGDHDGYDMVSGLSTAETDRDFGSDWIVPAGRGNKQFTLSMRTLNDKPVEVVHGFEWSRQFSTPEKEFMLLRRDRARNADFIVLFEPHRGRSKLGTFERFEVKDEDGNTVAGAVGINVSIGGKALELIFNPDVEMVTTVNGPSYRMFSVGRK